MRPVIPIARSVFWVMLSLIAWELFQVLRSSAVPPAGTWAMHPVDLLMETVLPVFAALALSRLFLIINQSARGTMNIYLTLSSPWAFAFWLGLGLALVGHGMHVSAHALAQSLPEVFQQGEFASKVNFLEAQASWIIFGTGLLLVTLALEGLGLGIGQMLSGPERLLFICGSLATYGFALVYLGTAGRQLIMVLLIVVLIVAVAFWKMSPRFVTYDPIGAFIVPGTVLAGLTLVIWTLVVGGQPTWP